MWGNTIAIFNVKKKNYKAKFSTNFILKKIKSTKIILKKKHKKMKKKGKKIEKKHVEKVKAEFSTNSILKKNSTKIILKTNMWRNTIEKKPCGKTL